MRALLILISSFFVAVFSNTATGQEHVDPEQPVYCAAFLPEGETTNLEDEWAVPHYRGVHDTGTIFEEGGELFREYVIELEFERLSGRVTLEEGYVLFMGKALSREELQNVVSVLLCSSEAT